MLSGVILPYHNQIEYKRGFSSSASFIRDNMSAPFIMSIIFTMSMLSRKKDNILRAKNKARPDLTAISFKLRNSLASVRAFSGLICANEVGSCSEKQKEFLENIITESDNILSYLKKIEARKMPVNKELKVMKFNLRTSLNSILGFANLIYDGQVGKISSLQKEFLENIISGSNDAIKTVIA